MQRLLQVLSTVEVVRTRHLTESSIEGADHTVGLWRLDNIVRQDGPNLERRRIAHCGQEEFEGCCRFMQ